MNVNMLGSLEKVRAEGPENLLLAHDGLVIDL
jgi:hypothetical protein